MSDTAPDDDRFDEPYDDLLDADGQPLPVVDLDEAIARFEQAGVIDRPAE